MYSGKHPFEFVALVGSIIAGGMFALGHTWPDEVKPEIPLWYDILWGLLFIVGATLALIGTLLNNRSVGVLLEQIGLMIISVTSFVCAISLAILAPVDTIPASIMFALLGVASLAQWIRLQRLVRGIIKGKYKIARG